jgi:hypothetical protein
MTTPSFTTTARPRKAAAAIITQIFHRDHAAYLDRLADSELAVGHHSAAERLSHEAQRLREVALS